MGKGRHAIFIGYRRGDSADIAGRIYDQLEARFGPELVFKDVDSIPRGEDYRAYVDKVVPQCSVFLPIIGPNWLIASVTAGMRRIDDPGDLVRIEIETALSTPGIRVIPVLVGGAEMPVSTDLPESLRALATLNAARVRGDPDFRTDMARLVRDIEALTKTETPAAVSAPPPVSAPASRESESAEVRFGPLGRMLPWMLIVGGVMLSITLFQYAQGRTDIEGGPLPFSTVFPGIFVLAGVGELLHRRAFSVRWDEHGVVQRNLLGERYFAWSELRRIQRWGMTRTLAFKKGGVILSTDMKNWWLLERYAQTRQPQQPPPKPWWIRALVAAAVVGGAFAALLILALIVSAVRHRQPSTVGLLDDTPAVALRHEAGEFDDCNGATWCPRMLPIPAGAFQMGSPATEADRNAYTETQRTISIRRFAVGKFDVTFNQWAACAVDGGCTSNPHPDDHGWGRGNRPVINVSWNDAQQYVQWLSRKTGRNYRLLTEAEWEYAARGGTLTAYYWGAAAPTCTPGAADGANYGECNLQRTQPVGAYGANPYGLYDMGGNVWQWVEDCWTENLTNAPTDGSAVEAQNCSATVARSGSWIGSARDLRAANRSWFSNDAGDNRGFRVARSLD